jgi:hypothetical protein
MLASNSTISIVFTGAAFSPTLTNRIDDRATDYQNSSYELSCIAISLQSNSSNQAVAGISAGIGELDGLGAGVDTAATKYQCSSPTIQSSICFLPFFARLPTRRDAFIYACSSNQLAQVIRLDNQLAAVGLQPTPTAYNACCLMLLLSSSVTVSCSDIATIEFSVPDSVALVSTPATFFLVEVVANDVASYFWFVAIFTEAFKSALCPPIAAAISENTTVVEAASCSWFIADVGRVLKCVLCAPTAAAANYAENIAILTSVS